MKSTTFLVVAIAGAAIAEPHGHHHLHRRNHQHQKRDRVVVYKSVIEQACRLAGSSGSALRSLAYSDCRSGLENGTYKAMGGQYPFRGINTLVTSTIIEQPTPTPVQQAPSQAPVVATPKPAISPSAVAKAAPPAPPPPRPASSPGQGVSTSRADYPLLNADFPSGKYKCGDFPSEYGAVRVDWQNLGGWASVQSYQDQAPNGLLVGLANRVATGCTPGTYCSYHCPEGMLKAQWPVRHQGVSGESVGGLECRSDNLLYLSRAEVSQKLCIDGSSQATAYIKNDLDEVVSICRTNYPGDEGESMWLEIPPGEKRQLAIVDQATYYRTSSGSPTSGQYYLNKKGLRASQACRWGDASHPWGNWAPTVVGLSWAENGHGYFGLSNNAPTQTEALLEYTVTVKGGDSDCVYSGSTISYAGNQWNARSPMTAGCTVGVDAGSTVVFHLTP